MIPKLFIITKLLSLLGVSVLGSAEGTLAYYHAYDIRDVCLHRDGNGWNDLNCNYPCLISGIEHRHLGETWLISLPNCADHKQLLRLCLVVDCGNADDLERLRERNEVIEIGGELARYCGYQDYVDDVRIWRLGDE